MSIIATAVKHLIAAGVSGDELVRAIAEMEAAQPVPVDPVAEKRRAYDRERKRIAKENRSTGIPPESTETAELVSPNEYISNPHPLTPAANAADPLSEFSDRVVEDWNRQATGTPLPQARKLNADRRKHLRRRVAENGEEAVFVAIGAMCRSDFHSGRSGKWTEGNLGWLLKSPENFQKMLERAESAKPADAKPKPTIAGGSLFQRLQAGEITQAEFDAQRAAALRSQHPPPQSRERSQSGSLGSFLPKIAGSA
ncbi:hypothetical protein [Sphingobium sp. CFD-1]|uniref:hypothetical protein n=1 Tax=Sphingobium sp. CFD-1 TaxID=2878545 RepID=UPI00214B67B3|nr:hypothetical protein [Sphingobium sp. CFD-1]